MLWLGRQRQAAAVVDAVVVQAEARAGNSRSGCCGESRLRERQAAVVLGAVMSQAEAEAGRSGVGCCDESG